MRNLAGKVANKRLLILWPAFACFSAAFGATVSDPTRPAPAWVAAQAQAVAPGAAAATGMQQSSGLEIILIGKSRKFAVIDGQVVKPGDSINGSKVVNIGAREVVAQDPSKSLKLTPAVEKKLNTPVPKNKTGRAASKRKQLVNRDGGTQ